MADAERDLDLTAQEQADLEQAIIAAFRLDHDADRLLRSIGFPRERQPAFGADPDWAWQLVFTDLENGLLEQPWRKLVQAALRVYSANSVLRPIAQRHGLLSADPDIVLTGDERFTLIDGIAGAFRQAADADQLLTTIRFPSALRPDFDRDLTRAWNEVFSLLENGILPGAPYRTILLAALRIYADHPTLRPLAEHHRVVEPRSRLTAASRSEPSSEQAAERLVSHLIVRADDEETRRIALAQLTALALQPEEEWSTGHAVSYRITTTDIEQTRRQLEDLDLGWTLVPPGGAHYLYQLLIVEGPDRRRFHVRGAPAGQTIGNLATEVVEQQYAAAGGTAAHIAVDRVHGQTGETSRLDEADSLHDAGVRDGDTLRVGYQAGGGRGPQAAGNGHDDRRGESAPKQKTVAPVQTADRRSEPSTIPPGRPLRVHVMTSSPRDTPLLRGDRELRAIRSAEDAAYLGVTTSPAAQLRDLRAILAHRDAEQPVVLHLSGHGQEGQLVFEDPFGESQLVPAAAVVELLRAYREDAGLWLAGVVLNSCRSADVADAFRAVADVVVAHRGDLDDDCAVAFAEHLYATLRDVTDLGGAARIAASHVVAELGRVCSALRENLVVWGGGAR